MSEPTRDSGIADCAPTDAVLAPYDKEQMVTYLRVLDAEGDGADWKEVARIVLLLDPNREPDRARRAWETRLARARWMTEVGYRLLLAESTH